MTLAVLKQYLSEFDQACCIEDKWAIAQTYQEKRWLLDIPIVAGEYIGDYWVVNEQTDELGRIIVAIPKDDEDTMHRFLVKVVDDYNVLKMTGAALVMSK